MIKGYRVVLEYKEGHFAGISSDTAYRITKVIVPEQ